MTSGTAAKKGSEPPFDPTSWHGALFVMGGVAAVLWVVQVVNAAHHYSLDARFGLRPREVRGLWGIGTDPFLHASYGHLLSNTIPFILIGWVVLLSGVRTWLTVTLIVVVGGGLLTWLLAPSVSPPRVPVETVPHGIVLGANGLIFGWLGYLLARAYFSRKLKWIVVAFLVLFFFGTLLGSLLPSFGANSAWQGNACGFVAGIGAAALQHPRKRKPTEQREPRTPAVS